MELYEFYVSTRTYVLFVDRIHSAVTPRIHCNGPPTMLKLKRLIRSLTLFQTRSDSLLVWIGVTFLCLKVQIAYLDWLV